MSVEEPTRREIPLPLGWVRLAAIGVVAVAAIAGVLALSFALGFYDEKADHFASLDSLDRQYGEWRGVPVVIRDHEVVEKAREAMPSDATYRVVTGPDWVPSYTSSASNTVEADFLRFYLMPRRQTEDLGARWIFCLGCDPGATGSAARVVAGQPGGMQFVEVAP